MSKSDRTTLLISDYGGHSFTYELAVGLFERGQPVVYAYCRDNISPKGRLDGPFPVEALRASADKYNIPRRVMSEIRYGLGTTRLLWRHRPGTHVTCNMPVISLMVMWFMAIPLRTRLVVWFQDAQGGIAANVLGGGLIPRALAALEGFVLRRADRVIAISEELHQEARRSGVRPDRIAVLENWAPIDEIPLVERDNDWARRHRLPDGPRLIYSGTLARKHRPEVLAELARAVSPHHATVIVISEGEGSDQLSALKSGTDDLHNLVLLPYQDFDDLPMVLGSADLLLVLLEPHAASFSVPSKTLSYLCAGRPILGYMPPHNTAARIITERAHAGTVVPPADPDELCRAALGLLGDPERRATLGANGRRYAEQNFTASIVIERFLTALA